MKIIKRKAAYTNRQDQEIEVPAESQYYKLQMEQFFPDTKVKQLWLLDQVIQDLSAWVALFMHRRPVPEIGGFLLGRVSADVKRVSFEQFVPAKHVEFSSPVRLDFGVADIMDLDAALENHVALQLVGWFHTHPGHMPYLSGTDLSTHQGFFTRDYMLAMVLDPLTPGFETGIFGQKTSGMMNNKEDALQWLSWKKVDLS